MKGNLYTIVFAAILGTVCALLLTAMGEFTKPYRLNNEEAEKKTNILQVLNVPLQKAASAKELLEIYNKNVTEKEIGDIKVYYYMSDALGEPKAAAFLFTGPGLWGPIEGFLALENDMKTIKAITFYKQEETPGLGGEIATDAFKNQFIGKLIISTTGTAGIVIKKPGGELAQNEVDGITGATMTCDKVQEMLNKLIDKIVSEQTDGS